MKCENAEIENILTCLQLSIDQFNILSNDKHGFMNNWKQYSSYWKLIQHILPNGSRICPKCGIVLKRRFRSHLLQHNIQPKQWYNDLYEYEHDPICPTCNQHVLKFIDKQLQYESFCCIQCSTLNPSHHKNRSKACKQRFQKYGILNKPETWTDEQIKNHNYTGCNDDNYKKLVDESQLKRDNMQYVSKLKIKRHISYRRTKKRNSKILGNMYFPDKWTDAQIRANGFLGKDDVLYKRLVDDICEKRIKSSSKAGKANNVKNGSNCSPGSWTDEQIKNRGYSGRDDLAYINKCKQKTKWSKRCGHITQKRYGCKLNGWGYKIDFLYNGAILHLDSLYELQFMLILLDTMPNEMLLNNQCYYTNTTTKFNGIGAISDIRTINVNTNVVTNWEIRNANDIDNINRKKFCTELHNEVFQLISFDDIKRYVKQLKTLGYDIDKIRFEAQHNNCILHKTYIFTYNIEKNK